MSATHLWIGQDSPSDSSGHIHVQDTGSSMESSSIQTTPSRKPYLDPPWARRKFSPASVASVSTSSAGPGDKQVSSGDVSNSVSSQANSFGASEDGETIISDIPSVKSCITNFESPEIWTSPKMGRRAAAQGAITRTKVSELRENLLRHSNENLSIIHHSDDSLGQHDSEQVMGSHVSESGTLASRSTDSGISTHFQSSESLDEPLHTNTVSSVTIIQSTENKNEMIVSPSRTTVIPKGTGSRISPTTAQPVSLAESVSVVLSSPATQSDTNTQASPPSTTTTSANSVPKTKSAKKSKSPKSAKSSPKGSSVKDSGEGSRRKSVPATPSPSVTTESSSPRRPSAPAAASGTSPPKGGSPSAELQPQTSLTPTTSPNPVLPAEPRRGHIRQKSQEELEYDVQAAKFAEQARDRADQQLVDVLAPHPQRKISTDFMSGLYDSSIELLRRPGRGSEKDLLDENLNR